MISDLQLISQSDLLHLRDPFNKSAYSCRAETFISVIQNLMHHSFRFKKSNAQFTPVGRSSSVALPRFRRENHIALC